MLCESSIAMEFKTDFIACFLRVEYAIAIEFMHASWFELICHCDRVEESFSCMLFWFESAIAIEFNTHLHACSSGLNLPLRSSSSSTMIFMLSGLN